MPYQSAPRPARRSSTARGARGGTPRAAAAALTPRHPTRSAAQHARAGCAADLLDTLSTYARSRRPPTARLTAPRDSPVPPGEARVHGTQTTKSAASVRFKTYIVSSIETWADNTDSRHRFPRPRRVRLHSASSGSPLLRRAAAAPTALEKGLLSSRTAWKPRSMSGSEGLSAARPWTVRAPPKPAAASAQSPGKARKRRPPCQSGCGLSSRTYVGANRAGGGA